MLIPLCWPGSAGTVYRVTVLSDHHGQLTVYASICNSYLLYLLYLIYIRYVLYVLYLIY